MRARVCLALFAVALLVRIAAASITGLSGAPLEDERGYVLLATSVAGGEGFQLALPEELVERFGAAAAPRTSFRGPGLPALLAPFVALGATTWSLRLVNLVLGALAAPALFLAAEQLLARRWAIVTALAYAVWPPLVYLSLRVLSEPLSQVLLLGAVACVVHRTEDGSGSPSRSASRSAWIGGVLAGLAVLVRPSALVPAGLLALAAGDRRRILLCVGALGLVLAPWVARNTWLHGRPLMTTNSGVTLVGGNCDAAADADPPGKWAAPWEAYDAAAAPPDLGMWGWSELGEAPSDRQFAADALSWVAQNPGRATALALHKLVRLVDPDPHSSKPDARMKRISGWSTVPPVLLLVVLALPRAWRERRRFAPWGALLGGTVLTAVVFYGDTRMRTTADPALLVLAAVGAQGLIQKISERRRGGGAPRA